MRVCVVGAGSIGGYVAVKLAEAGVPVTVIARGAHLAAIRSRGLKLIGAEGHETVVQPACATDRIADAGPQDVIILGMKAHQVEFVVDDLAALCHDETAIVPMQNGVPWWYFQRHGGEYEGRHVRTVDPSGHIAATIDPARIIGCVVYPAAEIAAPGVIRHIEGHRFPLGELDGSATPRVEAIAELFNRAGLKSPIVEDIRSEIWLKLWGNLTFNPVSALTRATLADICEHPYTRELAAGMMAEAQAVAEKLGVKFRVSIEKRIAGAARVGHHKTSMLQDIEAGRAPELDALTGAVIELAHLTGTPVPRIEAIYAATRLLADTVCTPKPEAAAPQQAPDLKLAT